MSLLTWISPILGCLYTFQVGGTSLNMSLSSMEVSCSRPGVRLGYPCVFTHHPDRSLIPYTYDVNFYKDALCPCRRALI